MGCLRISAVALHGSSVHGRVSNSLNRELRVFPVRSSFPVNSRRNSKGIVVDLVGLNFC
ncbi:hypothetical protein C1H46_041569 [Malus baccata]|uniref:Uncharacterized protein n=1 Tax=Malus baccata TaxID=106549 RepID=A0A540KF70_MALBA|nr:hypothetical protein C1H46_041569 [Malus baccata]